MASKRCSSRQVRGVNFGVVTRYLQHSDIGTAKNCCRKCLEERVSVPHPHPTPRDVDLQEKAPVRGRHACCAILPRGAICQLH